MRSGGIPKAYLRAPSARRSNAMGYRGLLESYLRPSSTRSSAKHPDTCIFAEYLEETLEVS